jgi:hypothetical protein
MAVKRNRDPVIEIVWVTFSYHSRPMPLLRTGNFVTFTGYADAAKNHGRRARQDCTAMSGFIADSNDSLHGSIP